MRAIAAFLITINLCGCAAMEHNRIVSEQRLQEEKLGIPTYGVDKRSDPALDFVHGAAWWIGADAVKEALR